MGPAYKKFTWWKIYMTKMQLVRAFRPDDHLEVSDTILLAGAVLHDPVQHRRGAVRDEFRWLQLSCVDGVGVALLLPYHDCALHLLLHARIHSRRASGLVVASYDIELARQASKLFASDYTRVYACTDVIGVEVGGALKNIFAIAAGSLCCFVKHFNQEG